MEIPHIIHQTFEDENYPSVFAQMSETWKEFHPDWQYEFWDRNRMNSFVQKEYPRYWEKYISFNYNVQRWDAIRYLILNTMGGMYADADYECLAPFDNHLKGKKCCFAAEPAAHVEIFQSSIYFNNAWMAAIPHHPFIGRIIDAVFAETPQRKEYPNKMMEVLETTGPLMISSLYEATGCPRDIYIIPEALVSPFTKADVQKYISGEISGEFEEYLEKKLSKAIAIHYFLGSWL